MNIAILGTGYVGLVTGACLADLGNNVLCIDSNTTKINGLKKSRMPFYEAGLEEIVSRNLKSSRLSFSSSYKNISSCELIFFCIDTPRGRNGKPDLSNLNQAIDTLALNLNISTTVVMKSTVPIGTNKKVIEKFKKSFTKYKKVFLFKVLICSNGIAQSFWG